MGNIIWYKRDPNKALVGMRALNLEQRGAYNTVLDLIYAHDNNLPDDDHFVAGWCGVDVRVWRRLKRELVERRKLYITDGLIRNGRSDAVVAETLTRIASARAAGTESARRRGVSRYRIGVPPKT